MTPPDNLDRPALRQALAAFELFQQRLVTVHAPEFTSLDITMSQAKLLYVLLAAGELSMSETAHRLGVTVSTASGAVEHLVGLGLLARADDPTNRRQVRVSITPAGARVLEQMRELGTRQLLDLCARMDDDDLEIVVRAIRLLADAAIAITGDAGTTTSSTLPAIQEPPE